ncbi:MAG: hypothetical protein AAGF13_00285 [Pseudomonadota bacterium]
MDDEANQVEAYVVDVVALLPEDAASKGLAAVTYPRRIAELGSAIAAFGSGGDASNVDQAVNRLVAAISAFASAGRLAQDAQIELPAASLSDHTADD